MKTEHHTMHPATVTTRKPTPGEYLWAAVLAQAVADACTTINPFDDEAPHRWRERQANQRSARGFIYSKECRELCEAIGLDWGVFTLGRDQAMRGALE